MPPGTLFPSPALCPLRSRQAPLHRHSRLPVSRPAGAPGRRVLPPGLGGGPGVLGG